MKIIIGLILLTLVYEKAYGQEEFIRWNKDVKIAWSDFRGKEDKKSLFSSMSAVGIYYKYNAASKGKVYKINLP